MDLKRFADRLAGNLSGGMKQKLALCCALIGRPRLLLLDEPTTGVDPVSRRDFWDVLATIAHEGVTIAVATPYLDEAERCSRIALIHKGVIQELGTPAELKQRLGLHRLELRGAKLTEIGNLVNSVPQFQSLVADTQEFGDRLDVLVKDVGQADELLKAAAAKKHLPLSLSEQEPTLENVFALTIKRSEPPVDLRQFPFKDSEQQQDTAIRAVNLSKTFGTFHAVRNVNISVAYGEIYGLLGANGAGKTTNHQDALRFAGCDFRTDDAGRHIARTLGIQQTAKHLDGLLFCLHRWRRAIHRFHRMPPRCLHCAPRGRFQKSLTD